jgi:hypothetical protein
MTLVGCSEVIVYSSNNYQDHCVLLVTMAGELKAPAVTRIIAVRTIMIVNVVIFMYITAKLSSYMYKELLNHVN